MARRRSGPSATDRGPDKDRVEIDRALIDAERLMMQTVQTSLSLIGFGFTITEFFNSGAVPGSTPAANMDARLLGEALLVLGLLLLTLGIWNQSSYRRRLRGQLEPTPGRIGGALPLRDTPSFLIAVLLLFVGAFALASVLFKRLF